MHELTLMRQVLHIVTAAALERQALRVLNIHLVVGENRSLIPETAQTCFEVLAAGSPAQDARLHVRQVKAQMDCLCCGTRFERPAFSFACPLCGALGSPTEVGNELYVESIELET